MGHRGGEGIVRTTLSQLAAGGGSCQSPTHAAVVGRLIARFVSCSLHRSAVVVIDNRRGRGGATPAPSLAVRGDEETTVAPGGEGVRGWMARHTLAFSFRRTWAVSLTARRFIFDKHHRIHK